jgi:hypothetical protein
LRHFGQRYFKRFSSCGPARVLMRRGAKPGTPSARDLRGAGFVSVLPGMPARPHLGQATAPDLAGLAAGSRARWRDRSQA